MEIRRSYDRLISTMGFPILARRHLYIESGPSWPDSVVHGYWVCHWPMAYLWFSQTLKSIWIWLLSWKVLDFFNLPWKLVIILKKCLKITFDGLENNGPRNLIICLCMCFYAFCTFDFNELRGFGNFVIKSPITTGVFHMANIVIWEKAISMSCPS